MTRFIITTELQHFTITLLIALFLFWRYRDWRLIPVSLLFGFFIDLDHLFDFVAYYGLKANLFGFFDVASYIEPSGKIYILLHGWEFIPIFAFLGKIFEKRLKVNGLVWAMILPYTFHLFLDQFSFPHHPLAYFLIFRRLNHFSLSVFNTRI